MCTHGAEVPFIAVIAGSAWYQHGLLLPISSLNIQLRSWFLEPTVKTSLILSLRTLRAERKTLLTTREVCQ